MMDAIDRRRFLQAGLLTSLASLGRSGWARRVSELNLLWMGSSTTKLLVQHLDEILNARGDRKIRSRRDGGYFRVDYLSRWQAEGNRKEIDTSMARVRKAIQSQKFDIVAFQLSYGIFNDPKKTEKHVAAILDEVCRLIVKSGAVPMIFDHWSNQPERMRKYCVDAAAKHGGKVAFCGSAMNEVRREKGKTFVMGGGHANFRGNYLMACVVYAALTGKPPVGLPSFKFPVPGKNNRGKFQALTASETLYLQKKAWKVQQEFEALLTKK